MNKRVYISDEITKEKISELKNGIHMVGAEVGSGKTTFIEKVLIHQAIKEGKRILIVAHRKSLVRQIAKSVGFNVDYNKDKSFFFGASKDEEGNTLDDAREEILDSVCITTYQRIEMVVKYVKNPKNWNKQVSDGWSPYDFDYIACDEPHYIVTDAAYNFNTIYSLDFLKECAKLDKKVFLLTGTPKPLTYINFGEGVNINVIRLPNSLNHNVEDITISKQSYLDMLLVARARNGEKAVVFVSSASVGVDLRDRLIADGISAGFVCADGNYKAKEMDISLKEEIIEERTFDVQIAVLTSVMNTGISIEKSNVKNVFMIGVFSPIEIQQSVARLRVSEDQKKVNLYIANSSMHQHLSKMKDYSTTIDKAELSADAFARRYGQYNSVRGLVNTYEGDIIHPCYLAFCMMIVDDYNKLKEIGIFEMLEDMFPRTPILSLIKNQFKEHIDTFLCEKVNSTDVFLEEFIRGILAHCEELQEVFLEIDGRGRAYENLKKNNFKIGKAKMNNMLEKINSKYKIGTKKITIDEKRKSIWVVKER